MWASWHCGVDSVCQWAARSEVRTNLTTFDEIRDYLNERPDYYSFGKANPNPTGYQRWQKGTVWKRPSNRTPVKDIEISMNPSQLGETFNFSFHLKGNEAIGIAIKKNVATALWKHHISFTSPDFQKESSGHFLMVLKDSKFR